MKKLALAFLGMLFLVGCTTQATVDSLNNKYIGKNLDQFIINNGSPYQKYRLNSGNYIYTWNSGTKLFALPTTTTYSGNASAYRYGNTIQGNYSGSSTTYGGGAAALTCTLQLHTNKRGKIISIRAMNDTLGVWKVSRCAEVLR